ncbi:hypothetical protein RND71_012536 [Anisodus tanguticus]|uniref:Uncharacterized protein n=1 Tax=Anisodus tanguticus TaxID=243964 RepID=A0AAE1SDG5_9SOLA|nr:hypothetical protein RND71_012536 [Anisodus tanguticus]
MEVSTKRMEQLNEMQRRNIESNQQMEGMVMDMRRRDDSNIRGRSYLGVLQGGLHSEMVYSTPTVVTTATSNINQGLAMTTSNTITIRHGLKDEIGLMVKVENLQTLVAAYNMAKLYEQSQNAHAKNSAPKYPKPTQMLSNYRTPNSSNTFNQKGPIIPSKFPSAKPSIETLREKNLCYEFHEPYHLSTLERDKNIMGQWNRWN